MLKSAAVPLLAIAAWCLAVAFTPGGDGAYALGPMPDFAVIDDVREKKARFFAYLAPAVTRENQRIRGQREQLLAVYDALRDGGEPDRKDRRLLRKLATEYRVTTEDDDWQRIAEDLLARVDVIPPRLALIQAAKESGWGTSRFARSANNLFGEWCFDEGCGMVPSSRAQGRRHEVESFDSVQDALASYLRNLNSHPSYAGLRERRAALRAAGEAPTALALADGLGRYSERGDAYVREVKSMIRHNEPMLETAL